MENVSELSRREWLIRLASVAPLAPLVLASLLTVIGPGDSSSRPIGPTILLGVATAGWTLLLLAHARWRHRTRFRVGYFCGLLVLMTVLILWSPWYALVTGFVFPQAFVLFSSSRGVLVGLVTACVFPAATQAVVSASGPPEPSYPLLASLVLPLLAAGWVAGRANDRRRALLLQLTETQQQLVAQAHRAGVAEERARLTGELHDTLTQALTATVARLEAARHSPDPDRARHQMEQASTLAREGLAESRRTLRALRSEALDGRGLDDALRALRRLPGGADAPDASGTLAATEGPEVRVEIVGDAGAVPSEIEHALYRVAREAVTNAISHARAGTVHVSLSWLDDLVLLDVTDDGVGFHPDADQADQAVRGDHADHAVRADRSRADHAPGGRVGSNGSDGSDGSDSQGHRLGLAIMRQRMRHVGGALTIESAPGAGTAVSASVPLTLASPGQAS